MKKKAIFDVSDDYYSSSDSGPVIEIAQKPKKVPENLTIDAIFQSRSKEQAEPPQKKAKLEEIESDNSKIDLMKKRINLDEYLLPDLQVINESIFNQTQTPFPESVFSLLKTKYDDNQQYPLIEFDLIHGFSYFESPLFDFTEDTIYTLLFSLLHKQDEVFGKIILKKLNDMPKLNFSKFLFFFREIMNTSNYSLYIYPSILCNTSYFEQTQDIQDDITLLYFSMIMCTHIVRHQYFFIVIENFIFLNPNFNLIPELHRLIFESQIQGVGNLVTYMRVSLNTAEFFIVLYMSLVNSLFGNDAELPTDPKELLNYLIFLAPHLKELIDSKDEVQLLRSSAILSLIEQIIVAAKLLNLISRDQAKSLCKSLKFNLLCENGTYLFLLKEQLHITLTQIEYIVDATLRKNNDDNPFF